MTRTAIKPALGRQCARMRNVTRPSAKWPTCKIRLPRRHSRPSRPWQRRRNRPRRRHSTRPRPPLAIPRNLLTPRPVERRQKNRTQARLSERMRSRTRCRLGERTRTRMRSRMKSRMRNRTRTRMRNRTRIQIPTRMGSRIHRRMRRWAKSPPTGHRPIWKTSGRRHRPAKQTGRRVHATPCRLPSHSTSQRRPQARNHPDRCSPCQRYPARPLGRRSQTARKSGRCCRCGASSNRSTTRSPRWRRRCARPISRTESGWRPAANST